MQDSLSIFCRVAQLSTINPITTWISHRIFKTRVDTFSYHLQLGGGSFQNCGNPPEINSGYATAWSGDLRAQVAEIVLHPSQSICSFRQDVWHVYARPFCHFLGPVGGPRENNLCSSVRHSAETWFDPPKWMLARTPMPGPCKMVLHWPNHTSFCRLAIAR